MTLEARILKTTLQKDALDIPLIMNHVMEVTQSSSIALFLLEKAEQYQCAFSINMDGFVKDAVYSVDELPEDRIDYFLRDSPIACIAIPNMASNVRHILDEAGPALVMAIHYDRTKQGMRQLILATSQRALGHFQGMMNMLLVEKAIRPSNNEERNKFGELVADVGEAVQELREVRDWAQLSMSPTKQLWQSTDLTEFLNASMRIIKTQFTFSLDPSIPRIIFVDQLLLRRGLLYPILRTYDVKQNIKLRMYLEESGLNTGFIIFTIEGKVPESVVQMTNQIDPNQISLALARDICFMLGGFLRVEGTDRLSFTVPIRFTDKSLSGTRIVLDLSRRNIREELYNQLIEMGASVSLYSEEQRPVLFDVGRGSKRFVICDPQSPNLSFYTQLSNLKVIVISPSENVRIPRSTNVKRWDQSSRRDLLNMLIES